MNCLRISCLGEDQKMKNQENERKICKGFPNHDWQVGNHFYTRREKGDRRSTWHVRPIYKCARCFKEVNI